MDFSEIPARPTKPFDARHLTDEQLAALTPAQLGWADLSEQQVKTLMAIPLGPDARAPLEANPERVPAPEDLEKLKTLFDWIDTLHDRVRSPWGMAWIEIQLMMAGGSELFEWIASDPPIHRLYRYRIDAPLDPDARTPDHLPSSWEEP
jgi:hypothetical protein